MTRSLHTVVSLFVAVVGAAFGGVAVATADPWIDVVRRFAPGAFAGFGQAELPWIVLGPPVPGGETQGSTDVLSLGHGGTIEFTFRDNLVFDGPGPDVVIFENAFHIGSPAGAVFTEYAYVEVSDDGREWRRFPFDAESGEGLAGATPVLAGASDPLADGAGGDRFDIADVGFEFVRHVRLIDAADDIDDVGNNVAPADKGGFDLDAAGAIHSSPPGRVYGTVFGVGGVVTGARVRLAPLDGTRKKRLRTDDAGRYEFSNVVPRGDYRVFAHRRGEGRTTRFVTVDLEQLEAEMDLDLQSAR